MQMIVQAILSGGLFISALAVSVGPATAQETLPATVADLQIRLDIVWMLVAAALVFMMQIGFMLLEAGMVRSKNSINVAQKNLLDFVFSVLVFAGFGFMLSFGASAGFSPVGWDMNLFMLRELDSWTIAFFVFQVMFCGTAATIVSGAVAERMKLPAYVMGTIVMAGLIYPVFVHWSWGTALGENSGAFLANMGFVDFAGSTVVHATGAWMALAACLVLGPRLGRFTPEGKPVRIAGHSPVLATSGGLLLFFGWIGFNGGSTVSASHDITHIIANTILAGSAGSAAGYLLGYWQDKVILPEKAVAGMLGGLVAVTAGCMVLDAPGAAIIGVLGGVVAVWGNAWLERLGIDDAVNAIGVHGFAGVVGTLGLALLAPIENLPLGSHLEQLQVQAIASGVNFAWAFSAGFIFFKLLDTFLPVRVTPQHEERGLNETEHATRLGIGHVEQAMQALASGQAGLDTRLPVDSGDEAEHLTRIFNHLMERLQKGEIEHSRQVEIQRSNEEAERLTALADATFEALCICVDGEIIDGNGALEELFGLPVDEIKGQKINEFVAPEDFGAFHRRLDEGSGAPLEISVIGAGGATPVEIRGRSIIYRGRRAEVIAIVDLRERKKAEQQIRFLAQHDPLTNLPNRALFNEKLATMIKRTIAAGVSSSVVLIDLDRFKDINDLHGHPAGDEVIKVTAERLRRNVAPGDMVARLGGDEFAVLQMTVEFASQAEDLAMRLINELSRPVEVSQGLRIHPSASIGVAICPRDGLQGEQLISRADTALYHAKNSGRNRYSIFELGMDQELRRRQMLEADLTDAIEQNQFELYFQPRLDITSASISGYEALIRWNHPEKGLVSPGNFIPIAENSGKIIPIGNWVLQSACRFAAEQLQAGVLSVNVSPRQFADKGFVETLEQALKTSGLEPARLEIEITESVLIDDDRLAVAILNRVKELGVRVALDDFGTGYSSLAYLSRFPFDTIKIDRSFVQNLKGDEDAVAIVDTIIRLGRALDMRLVAEGVEEVEELKILASRGCHEIQGYLLGRPAPVSHLQTDVPAVVTDPIAAVPVLPETAGISVRALNRTAEKLRNSLHAKDQDRQSGAA